MNKVIEDHDIKLIELINKDLKGDINTKELQLLKANKEFWLTELYNMKRRTEMQFTSSKARSFDFYFLYKTSVLNQKEYLDRVSAEMKWKVNANRFLQQLEARIRSVKLYD